MDMKEIEKSYYEKAKNSGDAITLDAFIKKAKQAGQGDALDVALSVAEGNTSKSALYKDFYKQFQQAREKGEEPKLTFERKLEGKKEKIVVPFEWYKKAYKDLGEEAIAKKDRKGFEEIKKEASKLFNLRSDEEIASFFDFKTEWLNTKENQKKSASKNDKEGSKKDQKEEKEETSIINTPNKKKKSKPTLEDEYLSETEKLNVVKKEIMNEASRYFPINTENFEDFESEIDEQISICMKKGGMKSVKNYRDYVRKGFAIFRNEFNKAVMNELDKLSEEIFVSEKEGRTKTRIKQQDKIK